MYIDINGVLLNLSQVDTIELKQKHICFTTSKNNYFKSYKSEEESKTEFDKLKKDLILWQGET